VNSRSTRRQIDAQRQDADKQSRAAAQQLAQKSQEVKDQREYYERQIREILEMVRNHFLQQHLDKEKFTTYREFASWHISVFWDWFNGTGEWTDELQRQAISGPPPDILASFAILAPPRALSGYQELRGRLVTGIRPEEIQMYMEGLMDDLSADLSLDPPRK
jgi:hypothetical protein